MLFEEHIGLVDRIVNKMNYGFISKEDLQQAGLMGLFAAVKKYNPSLGVKFNTFATYYIVGEIKKEMRNNHLIKLNKKIYRIIRAIKTNTSSSIDEVALQLGYSKEDIMLAYSYLYETTSLNQSQNDNEKELLDYIPESSRETRFNEALNSLENQEKEIIFLRYYKNYSQTEIAKIKADSQSKISRIESRALSKMRKYLLE